MDDSSFSRPPVARLAILWGLFFLICFSLGYPTLNRYSPSEAATNAQNSYAALADTKYYTSLIEDGFMAAPDTLWRYRVLVPYVAKPFYLLFKGHIGSWNPAFFSLLITNSLFIASAAVLLFLIGSAVTGQRITGFISSMLLLSHFNISNLYLAGLVDSSELFLMILTAWLLFQKKWRTLPFVAILAALARETAVVFTVGLAGSWFLVDVIRRKIGRPDFFSIPAYLFLMAIIGLGGLTILHYIGTSEFVPPWRGQSSSSFSIAHISTGTWGLMTSKALVYSFVWLLPLGLLGIRVIPKNWLWASLLTAAAATVLIVIMDAGENAGRPLFNTMGPMLLVAAASFITKFLNLDRSS